MAASLKEALALLVEVQRDILCEPSVQCEYNIQTFRQACCLNFKI